MKNYLDKYSFFNYIKRKINSSRLLYNEVYMTSYHRNLCIEFDKLGVNDITTVEDLKRIYKEKNEYLNYKDKDNKRLDKYLNYMLNDYKSLKKDSNYYYNNNYLTFFTKYKDHTIQSFIQDAISNIVRDPENFRKEYYFVKDLIDEYRISSFDLETNSFLNQKGVYKPGSIIQFGMVDSEFNIINEYCRVEDVSDEALSVHGLSVDHIKSITNNVSNDMTDIIIKNIFNRDDQILIGYNNITFDNKVVDLHLKRYNGSDFIHYINSISVDIYKFVKLINRSKNIFNNLSDNRSNKLTEQIKYFDLYKDIEMYGYEGNSHDAVYDSIVTLTLFNNIIEKIEDYLMISLYDNMIR